MDNLPDMYASWRQWRQAQRRLRLERASQSKKNKLIGFSIFGFFKKKEQTNGSEHNAGNH